MTTMATVSFWQRRAHEPDVGCDVAIVGGGIVGASTAYHLARREPGARIVLLDAGAVASGASGRNAGFLLQGAAPDPVSDHARYGAERARRLWLFTQETRDALAHELHGVDIGLETTGALVVAHGEEEDARLKASVRLLRSDGVGVAYLPPRELARRLDAEGFRGGLYVTSGAALDPVRLVRHLAQASGAEVLAHHPVVSIEQAGTRVVLETPQRRVFASRVVLAMGAYLPRLVPALGAYVRPVRAQMLALEPSKTRWLSHPVYSHEGYFYLRQHPSGHLLVGGARHLHEKEEVGYEDATTPALQQSLETYLHTHFPRTRGLRVERRWSGTMGFSPDGLPVVGDVPGCDGAVFATGFTGHGMSYGFRFGKLMAELAGGTAEPAYLDLFAADRF